MKCCVCLGEQEVIQFSCTVCLNTEILLEEEIEKHAVGNEEEGISFLLKHAW